MKKKLKPAGYQRDEAELSAKDAVYDETMLAQYKAAEPRSPPPPERNVSWLVQHLPGIPWRKTFSTLQQMCFESDTTCLESVLDDDEPKIIVVSPAYLTIISETLPRRDPRTWVSLLRTRALDFFGKVGVHACVPREQVLLPRVSPPPPLSRLVKA